MFCILQLLLNSPPSIARYKHREVMEHLKHFVCRYILKDCLVNLVKKWMHRPIPRSFNGRTTSDRITGSAPVSFNLLRGPEPVCLCSLQFYPFILTFSTANDTFVLLYLFICLFSKFHFIFHPQFCHSPPASWFVQSFFFLFHINSWNLRGGL